MNNKTTLVCKDCRQKYLFQPEQFTENMDCFRCGGSLVPENASSEESFSSAQRLVVASKKETKEREAKPNFTAMLKQLPIPLDELELIQELHKEGIADTLWLKRNYLKDNQEEIEVLEECKPLTISHYQALYVVGEGATGVVYKGIDTRSNQVVAIKRLHPSRTGKSSTQERFFRELDFLKQLDHPHILKLIDGGVHQGEYFLVTPFIEGGALDERIQEISNRERNFLGVCSIFAIIVQVAEALYYAHKQNLIHRDVKPANILLEENHPYLADFGLAKSTQDSSAGLTRGAVGTPCYMAPELWKKKPSHVSDIYSLSVMMYEVVSGEFPYRAGTPEQILAKQLFSVPELPIRNDRFPSILNDFILKGLAIDPKDRHRSAREFSRELTQILKDFS